MKTLVRLLTVLILVQHAFADTKVVLPDDARFARNEEPFLIETTIPGDFKTPEGIIGALLTLSDQAADKTLSNPFLVAFDPAGKPVRSLFAYYRGARIEGKSIIISFSENAMRYLNGTSARQQCIKGSIEATIRLHFPTVKTVDYEVDGEIVTGWDA